jgi:quinolinate synthase
MKAKIDSLREMILALKQERGAVILAHNYQIPEVQDIADFLGDSLELARISRDRSESVIVFCGVRFMAETAKILSPQKQVLLPVPEAGCPLADMITPQELEELKNTHPDAWVVSYVNTPAQIKALSDVCCTSANAIRVVKNVPTKKVIFTPDRNLGWWVQKNVPGKEMILCPGFCLTHEYFSAEDLAQVRMTHPHAEIMVHPECRREVIEGADFVLSTSGMLKRARESEASIIIVGTEEGLLYRLKKENPGKIFYSLGAAKTCLNMKMTTLSDLYEALNHKQYQIELEPDIVKKASRALERMVEYVA